MASIAPEAIRIHTDWTGVTIGSDYVTVASGFSINDAITAAIGSNKRRVLLDQNGVFNQAVFIPPHGFTDWMELATNVTPPAYDTRMTVTTSSPYNLATINGPMGNNSIQFQEYARRWRLRALNVGSQETAGFNGGDGETRAVLSCFPDNLTAINAVPDGIHIAHCLVHGMGAQHGTKNRRCGILMNASRVDVTDSTIYDINYQGYSYLGQSQSASWYAGPGKLRIHNCTLWRSTEGWAGGGAGWMTLWRTHGIIPGDFEISHSHIYGSRIVTKPNTVQGCANGGEAKFGRRLHIHDCIMEHVPADLQNGYGNVLYSADDPGTGVCDVLIENCWYKNTSGTVNMVGVYNGDFGAGRLRFRRAEARNCFATGNGVGVPPFRAIQCDWMTDVNLHHNLFLIDSAEWWVTEPAAQTRLTFQNNIIGSRYGNYKILHTGGPTGDAAWQVIGAATGSFTDNYAIDAVGSCPDPTHNTVVPNLSGAGFVDQSVLWDAEARYADLPGLVNTTGKGPDMYEAISALEGVEISEAERAVFEAA